MKIILTQQSNTQHQLVCERADGSKQTAVLETRSYLIHDFTHLAYEEVMGTQGGFWGSVAAGKTFAELRDVEFDPGEELWQIEMMAGALQQVMQRRRSVQEVMGYIPQLFSSHGKTAPDVSAAQIQDMQQRVHALMGEWNALPFGDSMTINWDL